MIKIIEFGSDLYHESIELRRLVLRLPLGLDFNSDELLAENNQIHFVYIQNQKVEGVLLLNPTDNNILKMRQVAVSPEQQGQGIGQKMVNFSEKWGIQNQYKRIELHARKTAVPFYFGLKYELEGDEFEEVGIPHFKMVKNLG